MFKCITSKIKSPKFLFKEKLILKNSALKIFQLYGIQDFCNGVSISKKLWEYSFDQLLTILMLLMYVQNLKIHS